MKFVSKAAVLSAAAGIAVVGGAGVASAYGAGAAGVAQNSPGIVSGNLIQVPIDLPINVCGNTVNAGALLNPAFGNTCVNL
ncbi:chaplin [Streptomyces sioyaensis]|uniref:Chaplin n=1 Tax=Streptomyces sioyaensis TaxID=67364 RepID=A0A4V1NNL8_9ACTN|nr:chaplin [Streptomyces sioyaensis]MBM4794351.1 chaplin [Streptomyces sioyaensis]RXS57629.1 chaplin [Streptomyces sioyaensis]